MIGAWLTYTFELSRLKMAAWERYSAEVRQIEEEFRRTHSDPVKGDRAKGDDVLFCEECEDLAYHSRVPMQASPWYTCTACGTSRLDGIV